MAYENRKKNYFKKLDVEAFIGDVREEEMLWNKEHAEYKNKPVVQKKWENIAAKHGFKDFKAAKMKWKGLVDYLRKLQKPRPSGDPPYIPNSWPFEADMSFMLENVTGTNNRYELRESHNGPCASVHIKPKTFDFGGNEEEMEMYNGGGEESGVDDLYYQSSNKQNSQSAYFNPSAAKKPRKFSPPIPNEFFPETSRAATDESGVALNQMAAKYMEFEPFAQNANSVYKMLVGGSQRKKALELKRRITQLVDEYEADFYEAADNDN